MAGKRVGWKLRASAVRALRHMHHSSEILLDVFVKDPVLQVKQAALDMLVNYRARLPSKQWAEALLELTKNGSIAAHDAADFAEMLEEGLTKHRVDKAEVAHAITLLAEPRKADTSFVAVSDEPIGTLIGRDTAESLCTTCTKCVEDCKQDDRCDMGNSESDHSTCVECFDDCNGNWFQDASCELVPFPQDITGVTQLFEPQNKKSGAKTDNDQIGIGIYGKLKAEGCRKTSGTDAAWSAIARAEAGKPAAGVLCLNSRCAQGSSCSYLETQSQSSDLQSQLKLRQANL